MPWLTGWTHRKKITIQHANVDALLADFPLYVGFSGDADLAGALATGYDVRFTQADGQSLLCYERESWAGGGGSAVTADFWVKVPSISAVADTDIYVYWGKAGAADGQDAASVWDADFQAVYHLHDDFLDSTSHNRDLTNYGSTDAAGKVGDCQSFDGTAYCLDGTGPTGSGDWTLEAVVSPGSAQDSTNLFTVIGKCSGGGANGFYLARYQGDCRLQVHGAPGTAYSQTSAQCSEQAWHHLTGTYDYSTGACQTFVDGAEDTNSTAAAGIAIGTDYGLNVGARNDGASNRWKGEIDEVRISSTLRSAAWIKFTHANIFEADHELTRGSAESGAVDLAADDVTHVHAAGEPLLSRPSRPPYRAVAGDVWHAGAAAGATFSTGARAGDLFHAGAAAGQIA